MGWERTPAAHVVHQWINAGSITFKGRARTASDTAAGKLLASRVPASGMTVWLESNLGACPQTLHKRNVRKMVQRNAPCPPWRHAEINKCTPAVGRGARVSGFDDQNRWLNRPLFKQLTRQDAAP